MPSGRSRRPGSAWPSTRRLKNRLCSLGLYEHYADANFTDFVGRRGDEDRGDPEAGRRDLRADAVDQPGLLGVLQGDPRAPHPERDRHQPAPGGEGLLRRRGAPGQPRGGSGGGARRHRPGHRQPDAAGDREGDELGPDRPDPRHRRLADGARRLFLGQSRRSASVPATTRPMSTRPPTWPRRPRRSRTRKPSTIRSSAPTSRR